MRGKCSGHHNPASRRRLAPVCTAIVLLSLLPSAPGATITYGATDLADTTPGQDRWLYSYTLDGFTFAANQGFSIFFDQALFALLQSPPPTVPQWDTLAVQPDPTLESNGFYDALALAEAPSIAAVFSVEFIWLGPGLPGSQPFTIYDVDFSTVVRGQTASVPPSLEIVRLAPGTVQLIWSPPTALLEQTNDLVTWSTIIGATSPLTISLSDPPGRRSYRLRTSP